MDTPKFYPLMAVHIPTHNNHSKKIATRLSCDNRQSQGTAIVARYDSRLPWFQLLKKVSTVAISEEQSLDIGRISVPQNINAGTQAAA
jgi:hypothetical protein